MDIRPEKTAVRSTLSPEEFKKFRKASREAAREATQIYNMNHRICSPSKLDSGYISLNG